MKRFLENKKGITLVALVITIIILLILAGITISQLSGSGLFENAKLAQQKSKEAQEKEEMQIAKYSNEIDSYVKSSNRESTDFTPLYGNITSTGTYTLNDSIEKYDSILFLIGNIESNKYKTEYLMHTKFIKDNYSEVSGQFTCYLYGTDYIQYTFKDKKTIIINFIPSDDDQKIIGIYGLN